MSFLTFAPKTDHELHELEKFEQENKLLAEGVGNFEVQSSMFKVSESGNPLIVLNLKVWDKNGKEGFVRDFLLTNNAKMEFKIKHFCYGSGLKESYDNGQLSPEDCLNRSGKCEIITQKAQKKKGTENEFYPEKSVIKDYIVEDENSKPNKKQEAFFDDPLNF